MDEYKNYTHNPPHLFIPRTIYMITGSTLYKQKFFNTEIKRAYLRKVLHEKASELEWNLEAWAILYNHYHFIARASEDADTLTSLIRSVHSITARYVNAFDKKPGRRIWHNYWDKCISSERDYLARLQYVHFNSVKHGLVENPEEDLFSSYKSFIEKSGIEFQREVFSQSTDELDVEDDF
ncbi:MAG: transposase [Anaerolineales bacterium]|nr:transposase [Anaerolineales bacterium]